MTRPGPRGRAVARGRWSLLLVALVFLPLMNGCASAATGTGSPTMSGDRRTVTAEELASVPGTSLYDAVQRLRPLWLVVSPARSRSVNVRTSTIVVVDGRHFGGVDALRGLPVSGVRELRYLTGTEASSAYPSIVVGGHVEAAIVVEYGNDAG